MTIEVTEEDIREGIAQDCRNCAVARAMTRTLDRPVICYVDGYYVHGDFKLHPLPYSVTHFIRRIDCGERVVPSVFWIPE